MRNNLHACSVILFLIGSIFTTDLWSQTYVMNGTPITDCDGVFTDSGGTSAGYGPNQNLTTTICSNSTGLTATHIQLLFSGVNIAGGDVLSFHDGPTATAGNLITTHEDFPAGDPFVIQASAANPSGCLTIVFTSDGAGQGTGWSATINCVRSCQRILSDIVSSTPIIMPVDTGWMDICPGNRIFLQGQGIYPQNGVIYQHSDFTSTFEWDFGDGGTAVGPNVSYTYDEPGGYIVQLTITDQLGCKNVNFLNQRVRVAPPPSFNITGDIPDQICSNDTIRLMAAVNNPDPDAVFSVIPNIGTFSTGGIVADSLPLPDGGGTCYSSAIEITAFNPGQVLTSIDDLDGICVVMEHSWLHDLEISLTCPSGNRVILHNITVPNSTEGAGATFLGIPNDPDQPSPTTINTPWGIIQPGVGWDYCWTPEATRGTWRQYSTANNPGTLPPGDYNSFTPLTTFLGCPLNGLWTIEACDRWGADNGMIFEWSINFAPEIFPSLETFSPAIVDYTWQNNPTIFEFSADSIAAAPQNAGSAIYSFSVTDAFGCTSDSIVTISVLPETHPDCVSCDTRFNEQPDVLLCTGGSAQLDVGPAPGVDLETPITFESFPQAPFGFSVHGPSNPFVSAINVNSIAPPNLTQPALQVASVCVDISTDWNADLILSLRAPNGSLMELSSNNGGASDNYRNTCFTPTAAASITTGTGPFTGNYRPEGNWTSLTGTTNGNWSLIAVDQFGINDIGRINSWSITFNSVNSFTYTWTPSAGLSCNNCATPTASPTVPTAYRVQAMDAYGCVVRDTIGVVLLAQLQAPVVSCTAFDDATIDFNWPNLPGFSDYEINVIVDGVPTGWTGPISTNMYTAEGYPAGSVITLEVRSYFAGTPLCDVPSGSSTCTVIGCPSNVPAPVVNDVVETPVLCNGGNTGTASVMVSGGTQPFTYQWSHSLAQITATATFLEAGNYQVTVTDANGCQVIAQAEVTEPDPITISFTPDMVNCFGGNDGTALAQATGGVGPYAYAWSTQEQGPTIDGLAQGAYQVTATDVNGCTAQSTVNITQPTSAVSVQLTQSYAGCFETTDNEATAVATGGTGTNYTYTWSNGQTNATAIDLAPGTYSVVAVDENNCPVTGTVSVADLEPITFEILVNPPSCYDFTDGALSVTQIMGGAAQQESDYSFNWSTAHQTVAIVNLSGGNTYSVTVTDQQGCSAEDSRLLENPDPLVVFVEASPALCFGSNDGQAAVSIVSGPNETYTYRWDNNAGAQDTPIATGLVAGTYSVFVTDNEGCTGTGSATVTQPEILNLSFSVQDNGCFGEAKGSITASATGGVGNYTYLWSNGASSNQVTNLQAGQYQLTLTDGNNCVLLRAVDVDQPDALTADIKPTDVACFDGRNGSLDVSVSGGTPPFLYSLNNRDFVGSSNLIGLSAGTYAVYIKDAKGCLFYSQETVNEPAEFLLDAGSDVTIVYGDSVQLQPTLQNAQGGVEVIWLAPYEGTLSCNECPMPFARPEYTIDYEVYAIDEKGCEATDLIRVIVDKIKVIEVPTGFTPNGDGANDRLLVHGRPGSRILSFQVFDRWGELIHQDNDFLVNDPNVGWDGSYKDQALNSGVYLWVLRVLYDDATEEVLRGQTTLIR